MASFGGTHSPPFHGTLLSSLGLPRMEASPGSWLQDTAGLGWPPRKCLVHHTLRSREACALGGRQAWDLHSRTLSSSLYLDKSQTLRSTAEHPFLFSWTPVPHLCQFYFPLAWGTVSLDDVQPSRAGMQLGFSIPTKAKCGTRSMANVQ